jgi:O-antigen ligase
VKQIATLVFVAGIAVLFWLERDRKNKPSKALLLPFIWLLIAGSRNVGEWLQVGSPHDNAEAYLDGNPLDRNILSLLIALGIWVLVQRRQKVVAVLRANGPLILYFSYCLVSIVWSDFPFVGLKRWVRAVGDIIMVMVILTDRDWGMARRKVYAWAPFLLLPLSVLFIRYYPDLGRSFGNDGTMYWTGVTENKNELGMICMVFGLASLACIVDLYKQQANKRRTGLLIAHGIIFVMALWLIHIANSATSLACLLIGSTLLIATSMRVFLQKPALVNLLVAALLGVGVSSLFLGVGSGLVSNLGRNSTLTGRTELWSHVLQLVDNPIFGTGYESFWVGARQEAMRGFAGPGINQAHNAYIETYINLGWVGLSLLGFLIVSSYQKIIASLRRNPEQARLGLAYFVVTLSYGFTEAGAVKFRNPVWISFLMSVLATSVITKRQAAKSNAASLPQTDKAKTELAAVQARTREVSI